MMEDQIYSFGNDIMRWNRTIIMFGEPDSGKSRLISGMINYIVGVKWEDNFRFVLVDEDQLRPQAHNQTSEVTVYKINHQQGFKIAHSLTIVTVDIPGIGDIGEIDRHRQIPEQLFSVFSSILGVSEIDAVHSSGCSSSTLCFQSLTKMWQK